MTDVRQLESGLWVESYGSFEEVLHLQSDWDSFVESCEGDIYLTFDWCKVWWEHYGAGRALRLYVYREVESIVGLLPFFFETVWIGPIWLKVAKLVGADYTTSMVNFVIQEEHAQRILRFACEDLVGPCGCDAIVLGPLAENYSSLRQLYGCNWDGGEITIARDHVVSPYTTFPLPHRFEEYVAQLQSGERRKFRKASNLAHRSFAWTHDVVSDISLVKSEFDAFVRMHTEQWGGKGSLGHFQEWPFGVEFNAEMASVQAELGRLRLVRSRADGLVVSYVLCYSFGGRWYARLPARLVGPDWDRFGLGRVGLFTMLELAISEGMREIEGGAGHYAHKIDLGAQEHPLHTLMFVRSGAMCKLRVKLFVFFADMLHFCYYRVWFLKLVPKLPLKRRPLWKLWIRTRL